MRTRVQCRCSRCRRRDNFLHPVGGGTVPPPPPPYRCRGQADDDHGHCRCCCNDDVLTMMPWGEDDDHEVRIHLFRSCIPRQSSASSSSSSSLIAVVVLLLVVVILVMVVEVAIGMLQCHRWTPHRCKHPIGIPWPRPHRAEPDSRHASPTPSWSWGGCS